MTNKKPVIPESETRNIAYGYNCPVCKEIHTVSFALPEGFELDSELIEDAKVELAYQYVQMHPGEGKLFKSEDIKPLYTEEHTSKEPSFKPPKEYKESEAGMVKESEMKVSDKAVENISDIVKALDPGMRVETESKMEQQIDEYINQLVNTPPTDIWDGHSSPPSDSREEKKKDDVLDQPVPIVIKEWRPKEEVIQQARETINKHMKKRTRGAIKPKDKTKEGSQKPSRAKVKKRNTRNNGCNDGIRFNFPPQ